MIKNFREAARIGLPTESMDYFRVNNMVWVQGVTPWMHITAALYSVSTLAVYFHGARRQSGQTAMAQQKRQRGCDQGHRCVGITGDNAGKPLRTGWQTCGVYHYFASLIVYRLTASSDNLSVLCNCAETDPPCTVFTHQICHLWDQHTHTHTHTHASQTGNSSSVSLAIEEDGSTRGVSIQRSSGADGVTMRPLQRTGVSCVETTRRLCRWQSGPGGRA